MSTLNKDPRDVIIKPIISEKSYSLIDQGKYTFEVDPRSNKTEIKQAVEHIFNVKVDTINTLNRQGKTRKTRFGLGKRKDTKRAIVTLKSGSIDIFTYIGYGRDKWQSLNTSQRLQVVVVHLLQTLQRSPARLLRSRC
jgi:large subunit ribosomal protein L23